MKKNKKELLLFIVEILISLFYIISLGVVGYYLIKLNIIPTKYLIIGLIGLLMISGILFYFLLSKKIKISKIISAILILLIASDFVFGTKYVSNTYRFFENTKVNYDVLTYSVLVLKESNYNNIEDLNGKELLYLKNDYAKDIENELKNKVTFEGIAFENFGGMAESLLDKEVDAIVIEESYITLAKEEVESFEESTKSVYSFELQVKAHEETNSEENKVDIAMNPFIIYVSGIDQYGNNISTRARSDVNQLIVINPKTNHILLVNTPRDYYVQLAGTTGLKDKLTHAGVYGVEKSLKTLENFYGVDISYYIRVNFDSLVKIVDVIGGIDVYSDTEFDSYHFKGWHVLKGINHMDGKKALAYSRERYAYISGDHHRGKNQQDVIAAIINKVTNSKVLISKYNSILNSLNGSFQTDMPMEEITSFIKYQIDKMPSWNIESIAVTGSGAMEPTYSMGSKLKLYVMNPNMDSVNKAKQKINEVLNEG